MLTFLVPAYNEAAGLAETINSLLAQAQTLGIAAEILIVNDASADGTGAVAEGLAARHSAVRVVHHPQNRGIGGGFMTGAREARGEWLMLIPADLALDPAEIRAYLAAAPAADIVVGNRSDMRDYAPFRLLVHYANITLIRWLFRVPLHQFQYICLYRLSLLRALEIEYWHSAFFHAEILIKAHRRGARLVEVPIRYVPRTSGRATGASWRAIRNTLRDMFTFWWRGA
jgi:glycosyltransferase involved in cell wall biosynthesis